jgi:hypothetical protein
MEHKLGLGIGVSFHPFSFSNTDYLRAAWKTTQRHNGLRTVEPNQQFNNQHDDESSFLTHNYWVVDVWFYVWIIIDYKYSYKYGLWTEASDTLIYM